MLARTRAMAARLLAAEGGTPDADAAFDPFPDAQPVYDRPAATTPVEPVINAPAAAPAPVPPAAVTAPPRPGPAYPSSLPMGHAELIQRLGRAVRDTDDPAFAQAVAGVGLSLADPSHTLDPGFLDPLRPGQRRQVEHLHQALLVLLDEASASPGLLTRDALLQRLDAVFLDEPIRIATLELCRSVQSYGVYDPFTNHNFLSGQPNRAIVYVELDHFRTQEVADGYEVKLKQELILYNEADGLAVWKAEPVQVVDASRNARRDFYIVQMMSLPARLASGKYRLKVRITDEHGESVDETTAPIRIVADEALLSGAPAAE